MARTPVYCKDGTIVGDASITQYEGFFRSIIPKFLPACNLIEASMAYDDLLNQLRLEAFRALSETYDPEKALKAKVVQKTLKKAQAKHDKAKATGASDEALAQILQDGHDEAVKISKWLWIRERCIGWLRRNRYRFHPSQLGYRSVSLEAIVANVELDANGAEMKGLIIAQQDDVILNREQVEADKAALLAAQSKGDAAVKKLFASLSKDRQEELVHFLEHGNVVIEKSDSVDWDRLVETAAEENGETVENDFEEEEA